MAEPHYRDDQLACASPCAQPAGRLPGPLPEGGRLRLAAGSHMVVVRCGGSVPAPDPEGRRKQRAPLSE